MEQSETNAAAPHPDEERLLPPERRRRHAAPWRGRDSMNGADLDTDVEPGLHFPLPAGGFVVSLDPGVENHLGRVDASQIQNVRSVHLSAAADHGALGGDRDRPTDIDPLTAAEALGTLAGITGTACIPDQQGTTT